MANSITPSVAVIGAGISGVVAAAHLIRAGLEVTVFERSTEAGGVWVYDERLPDEPVYAATRPSLGEVVTANANTIEKHFSQPGACYLGLKNNVSTRLLELTLGKWPQDTPEFVPHHILKDYIQQIASTCGVDARAQYNTAVTHLEKVESKWLLHWARKKRDSLLDIDQAQNQKQSFDHVVIASGHYHAPRVPDIPYLKEAKTVWKDRISHSKAYRNPEAFRDRTVLLIGAGASSTDNAKELGTIARRTIQSFRHGAHDLPATMLPDNSIRLGEIEAFEPTAVSGILPPDVAIPLNVKLRSGSVICNIDHIIVCTGYNITIPFLPNLHEDYVLPTKASETVLVTDGSQVHNLHKDIFYIPDPSLSFIGVPYFTATFTLFEFQAIVLTEVLAGRARLPSKAKMRREYSERVIRKGAGKSFHSLRGIEEEYVEEMLDWVNAQRSEQNLPPIPGHTLAWKKAKEELREKQAHLFAQFGEPNDETAIASLALVGSC